MDGQALVSFYGMLLLVKTRKLLEAESRAPSSGPAPEAKEEGLGSPGALEAGSLVEQPQGEAGPSDFSTEDPSVRALMHGRKHDVKEPEEEGEGYFLRITSYGELGNRVMGTLGQVTGPGDRVTATWAQGMTERAFQCLVRCCVQRMS